MSDFRITCKVHDNQNRVVAVKVSNVSFTIDQVWYSIEAGHTFHTFENGRRSEVRRRVSTTGRKFITTHPDGVTENNLDELRPCQ